MFSLRTIGCSFAECFRKWNHQLRKAACLLISLALLCSMGLLYIATLREADLTMSLLEPAVALMLTPINYVVLVCSILAMNADAPFYDLNDALTIHRFGRMNWAMGRLLYLLLFGFISPFFLCAIVSVVFAPFTSGVNMWTEGIVALSLNRDAIASLVNMQFAQVPVIPTNIIINFSPIGALALQCLLSGLLSAGLSIMMMVINMTYNRNIGVIVCFALLLVTPALVNGSSGVLRLLPTLSSNLSSLLNIKDARQMTRALFGAALPSIVLILIASLLMVLRTSRHSFKWGE